jgi:type I restriction enzyme S subunit
VRVARSWQAGQKDKNNGAVLKGTFGVLKLWHGVALTCIILKLEFCIVHSGSGGQLSQLADINGGFAFKSTDYTDEGTRVVRISDFDEFGFKDHKVVRHPFSPDLQKFTLAEYNILMAMTGGTVGKSYFVKSLPEPMVVNQRVATIKVFATANPSYVDIAIRSEMTQEVIRKVKNSTNDNISMGDIKGFAIPLPPHAEQKRIVARVEELLRWCDTLEAQLHQTRTLGAHLLDSTLHHLLAA